MNEYKGVNSIITIKCKKEEHEPYTINFNGFKNGSGCKKCQYNLLRDKFALPYEEVKNAFEKENYKLLSPNYINANSPLDVECDKGHVNQMTYGNFSAGHKCSECNGNKKHTLEYVKKCVSEFGYTVVSHDYLGSNECIELMCDKNHIYPTRFSRFQQGHGCPKCNQSKGEKIISDMLKGHCIEYKPQKKFKGLKGTKGGLLSYDFYVESMNLLIEYQGEYHDGSVPIQTKEEFEIQKNHDRRKKAFAKANKIELLEIWYWDFDNIESIIKDKLGLK